MDDQHEREPIGQVPAVVGLLILAMLGVSAAFLLGQGDLRASVAEAVMLRVNAADPQTVSPWLSYALHPFLHDHWGLLAINAVLLMAFGSGGAAVFGHDVRGSIAFLILFYAGVGAGALAQIAVFGLAAPGEEAVIFGGSPGVFSAIAASMYLMRMDEEGRLPSPFAPRYLGVLAMWLAVVGGLVVLSYVLLGTVSIVVFGNIAGLLAGAVVVAILVASLRLRDRVVPAGRGA